MIALERLRQRGLQRQGARPSEAMRAANGGAAPARSRLSMVPSMPPPSPGRAPQTHLPSHVRLTPLPRRGHAIDEKARAKTLKALKIDDAALVLLCVPSSYMDATEACVRTRRIDDGRRELFLLKGTGRIKVYDRHNREISCEPYGHWLDAPWRGYWSLFRRASIEMEDADGERIYCSVFAPALARDLAQAGNLLMHGELATFRRRALQKVQPVDTEAIGYVYASYATPGSATKNSDIRALVLDALATEDAIDKCVRHLRSSTLMTDEQMIDIVRSIGGCADVENLPQFLRLLHEPDSLEQALALQQAAKRLAVAGLIHAARIHSYRPPHPQTPLKVQFGQIEKIKADLPLTLTRDQHSAIVAITEAMKASTPMNALLCGDVGTGKTICFAIPAVAAQQSGHRVSIIAPTEILADQLASKFRSLFPQSRVHRVYAGDKSMPADAICIGTAGIGSVAKKCGYVPDLLIIDEQHKMAVATRRTMAGPNTHILEASATPIPQALAATLFAGTQMIVLRQSPVAREISSQIYDDAMRGDLSRRIRETLAQGHRVMIIYPRVHAAQEASVEQAAASLSAVFPGQVGYLHGKLRDKAVEEALSAFREGRTPLLVASTIVETGIDVPDVRLLIVREADRFGIAQLHQLRGRLARNGGQAHFAMHVDDVLSMSTDTMIRLSSVASTTDGFVLAEDDMHQRGFGDLLGEQQNGEISLPMRLLSLSASEVEAEARALESALETDPLNEEGRHAQASHCC